MKRWMLSTLLAAVLATPAIGFSDFLPGSYHLPGKVDSHNSSVGGGGGTYDSDNIRDSGNIGAGRGAAVGTNATSAFSGNTVSGNTFDIQVLPPPPPPGP